MPRGMMTLKQLKKKLADIPLPDNALVVCGGDDEGNRFRAAEHASFSYYFAPYKHSNEGEISDYSDEGKPCVLLW